MMTVKGLKKLLKDVDETKEIETIYFFGGHTYEILNTDLHEKNGKLYIKIW